MGPEDGPLGSQGLDWGLNLPECHTALLLSTVNLVPVRNQCQLVILAALLGYKMSFANSTASENMLVPKIFFQIRLLLFTSTSRLLQRLGVPNCKALQFHAAFLRQD